VVGATSSGDDFSTLEFLLDFSAVDCCFSDTATSISDQSGFPALIGCILFFMSKFYLRILRFGVDGAMY